MQVWHTASCLSAGSPRSDEAFVPSSRCFGTQVSGDDISQSVVLADRDDHFLVSTDSNLGDCRVTKVIGIVSAGHVRSRSLPADLWTAIGGMFGGEASMYSHLANETCTQAIDSAVHQAKELGADALVGVRLIQAITMNRLIFGMHKCIICYGTAVKISRPGDADKAAPETEQVSAASDRD